MSGSVFKTSVNFSFSVLFVPLKKGELILDTNASGHGISAVLSQVQQETEKVLAYYNRILSKAERNYCVSGRKLWAVGDSVKSFDQYLYGRIMFH